MLEWDDKKRITNLAKHRLDFRDADGLFDGRPSVTLNSSHMGEERFTTTGVLGEMFVTVIWTWRGEKRRIISMRSARDAEKRAHRELHGR
jgi:uncharacterized protein